MKRIIAIILASLMLLALVACNPATKDETTTDAPTNNEETTTGANNNETTEGGNNNETTEGGNAGETTEGNNGGEVVEGNVIAPNVPEDSWGYAFWNVFVESIKNNANIESLELAGNLLMSEAGQALGMAESMPVEPGYLTGFGPVEIAGFESATMFVPWASGYAFVGYTFELAEDADVAAFIQNLDECKDMRWMMCMTAEIATIGAYENYVLMVMSPVAMPGAISGEAEILYPENAEDGTYAAEIWNFFEMAMGENPMANAEEMSYAVAYSPAVPFNMAMVNPVDTTVENAHFANGFDSIESIFSITEEGSDVVIYVFSIELGLMADGWGAWYITGEDVVWGAYNNMLIAIHGANTYIQ